MIGIISVILPYAISTRKEHRLIVSDKFEDTNGVTMVTRSVNRRTDNTIPKNKRDKQQSTNHYTETKD
jgi:hypothetical protein